MAQLCDECGKSVHRKRFMQESKKWVGVDCGCTRDLFIASTVGSFSDLTLEHVHDEGGKPIRVTSIRQLREAEKKHNFVHRVANYDGANIDTPHQHAVRTVGDMYQRKFGRN